MIVVIIESERVNISTSSNTKIAKGKEFNLTLKGYDNNDNVATLQQILVFVFVVRVLYVLIVSRANLYIYTYEYVHYTLSTSISCTFLSYDL